MDDICAYGCGRPALHLVGSKPCCSNSQNSCPSVRARISKGNKSAWVDPDVRARNTEGLKKTPEWRQKIGATLRDGYRTGRINHPMAGKQLSPERRRLISEYTKLKTPRGNNHPGWTGGDSTYWHRQARNLFGKTRCDICCVPSREIVGYIGKPLSVHCMSNDFRYMQEINWLTVCTPCHNRLHGKAKRMTEVRLASTRTA